MRNILIKEIHPGDRDTLTICADMIWRHSWGLDYPFHPLEETLEGEYHLGAYDGDKLVGYIGLNRSSSLDGQNAGDLWLSDIVVLPAYRRQGIFSGMYKKAMAEAFIRADSVLTCTDKPVMHTFFESQGWELVRRASDESGSICNVYALSNPPSP